MNIRLDLLTWTAAAAMALIPATALAAADSFIWFEGEQGNSTDPSHKSWFEIKEFVPSTESPSSTEGAKGGAGSGKVKFNEFTIKKIADAASPSFYRALSTGRHYPTVKVEIRKAGGNPQQFVTYVFTNVVISKINSSGAGDKGSEESLTFAYGEMSIHQAAGGQTAPAPIKVAPPSSRNPSLSR